MDPKTTAEGREGLDQGITCILVADQDAAQRQLIDMLLSGDNYRIVSVENGRQALEFLRLQTPDLAILDLDLPGAGGADVCEKIKTISRLARVPVILTTIPNGDPNPGVPERTRELARLVRADLLIPKPLGDKNLRVRVRDLLEASGDRSPDPVLQLRSTQVLDEILSTPDRLEIETKAKDAVQQEHHIDPAVVSERQQEKDLPTRPIEQLNDLYAALTSALADQEEQLETLRVRLDRATSTVARDKVLLEDREAKLSTMQRENELLGSRIEHLVEINAGLKTALADQETLVETLEARLDSAVGEVEAMTRRLTEIEERDSGQVDGGLAGNTDLDSFVDAQAREIESLNKRNRLLIEAIEKEKRRSKAPRTGRFPEGWLSLFGRTKTLST